MNAPFHERHRDLRIGNWVVQPRTIGLAAVALTAIGVIIHGFGMKASGRLEDIRFEKQREWDAKHPDSAIGDYTADRIIIHADGTEEVVPADVFEKMQDAEYEQSMKKIGAAAASAVATGSATAQDAVETAEETARTSIDDAEAKTAEDVENAIEEEIDETKGGQE